MNADAPLTTAASNDHFQIIVGGIVAVLVVLIPLLFNSIRTSGRVSRIRDQVENDHTTNFREEADERHDANSRKLDWIIGAVTRLQGDVSNLYTRDTAQDAQLEALERTINPLEKDSPWRPQKPSPKHSQAAPSQDWEPPAWPSQTGR